ncbi:hypothetical protein BGZ61DRAFT_486891 [Ilyonectria robusta]|uniref:uncharacterized protein n=1 Tax=Ilyonectria robusta TaxID=1079257 RepID=UPI001E8DC449|nr:uncharacterized protein BGZ61DRAFT_486891 [Ilyonectria robusta]KAH8654833.1 hypothetical protein BGZ61DRAFT_486891 [Ilyonectria robusta]
MSGHARLSGTVLGLVTAPTRPHPEETVCSCALLSCGITVIGELSSLALVSHRDGPNLVLNGVAMIYTPLCCPMARLNPTTSEVFFLWNETVEVKKPNKVLANGHSPNV